MTRFAAASPSASKMAIPVFVASECRPHEDQHALGEEPLEALEMADQTALSSSVIVAAKSSRGRWMK